MTCVGHHIRYKTMGELNIKVLLCPLYNSNTMSMYGGQMRYLDIKLIDQVIGTTVGKSDK